MKGFSYIETIIYIAVLVLLMMALIPFLWNVVGIGVKSATQQVIGKDAATTAQIIAYTIRNASSINSITASSASFATTNPATNPTVFDLVNNTIMIKQGIGSAVALTSQDTSASALLFTNYSSLDGNTQHVAFLFTLSGKGTRHEFVSTITLRSSAEIRSH